MDWIRDHLWETWLALSIVLGVAEMFSLDLILGMLAAGAVVGMALALLGLPVAVQVLAVTYYVGLVAAWLTVATRTFHGSVIRGTLLAPPKAA